MKAPLTTLDRYLMRELVGPFLVSVVLFTFFFLIDRIYHLTDLVITKPGRGQRRGSVRARRVSSSCLCSAP
jgi:hypothetical protein